MHVRAARRETSGRSRLAIRRDSSNTCEDVGDDSVLLAATERAAIEGTATPTDSVDMDAVRVSLFKGSGGLFYPDA